MGLPAEEFPRFPEPSVECTLKMEQNVLKTLLRRTAYAASTDESRFVLNGVLFSLKQDKLTTVATDGRRLALAEAEISAMKGKEAEFIVPNKTIAELLRLLSDSGDVAMFAAESQVIAEFATTRVVSKLVEGAFPNFRQVIPSEAKERITLERETFLAALHRASLLASEKHQAVKLNFTKNNLTITATTPEVGEAKETMAINYKGKEIGIGFNPHFLMDPLRNLDADEIVLELTDDLSPGVIKISEPFLYVLMPMRLN